MPLTRRRRSACSPGCALTPRTRPPGMLLSSATGARIFRWCRGRGLQESDAEDVTQNVLLDLARQMRTFERRSKSSGTESHEGNFSGFFPRLYFNDAATSDGPVLLAPRGQFRARGTDYIKPRCPYRSFEPRAVGGNRLLFLRRAKNSRAVAALRRAMPLPFPSLAPHRPAGTPTLAGFFGFLAKPSCRQIPLRSAHCCPIAGRRHTAK